jgi:hypothetical protein
VSYAIVAETALRVTLPAKPGGGYDLVVTGPGGASPATTFTYTRG